VNVQVILESYAGIVHSIDLHLRIEGWLREQEDFDPILAHGIVCRCGSTQREHNRGNERWDLHVDVSIMIYTSLVCRVDRRDIAVW
jgi:hypothetical protein